MHIKRAFLGVLHFLVASAIFIAPNVWGNETATHSVADVLRSSERGSKVVLEGVILREVNFESVLFADETGQIEVLFEEGEHLPRKALEPGQPILLSGDVESGYKGKKVIDYYSVRILTAPPRLVTLVEEEQEARAGQQKGFVESLKDIIGLPETAQVSPAADAKIPVPEGGASKSSTLQTKAAEASAKAVTVTSGGSAGTHSIAEILSRPRRGMEVALEGVIVREVNYETVLFDDGTGQIEVIIDEDENLPSMALEERQRLLLEGTVQKELFRNEIYIDYESARLLPGS